MNKHKIKIQVEITVDEEQLERVGGSIFKGRNLSDSEMITNTVDLVDGILTDRLWHYKIWDSDVSVKHLETLTEKSDTQAQDVVLYDSLKRGAKNA